MTVDIDALAAVVSAMTPGPWTLAHHGQDTGPPSDIRCDQDCLVAECHAGRDAAGIAALRNASAELLRLARVGSAYLVYRSAGRIDDFGTRERAAAAMHDAVAAYNAATKEPT